MNLVGACDKFLYANVGCGKAFLLRVADYISYSPVKWSYHDTSKQTKQETEQQCTTLTSWALQYPRYCSLPFRFIFQRLKIALKFMAHHPASLHKSGDAFYLIKRSPRTTKWWTETWILASRPCRLHPLLSMKKCQGQEWNFISDISVQPQCIMLSCSVACCFHLHYAVL
jgi:hypothetical protein